MFVFFFFFFFKQKTAYEMRISDWSSDVCSSDLVVQRGAQLWWRDPLLQQRRERHRQLVVLGAVHGQVQQQQVLVAVHRVADAGQRDAQVVQRRQRPGRGGQAVRSEEHTSELQSLMRISYAVFRLKKTQAN